jgi:hypothetical protein
MFYTVKLALFLDKGLCKIMEILIYIFIEPTLVPKIVITIYEFAFFIVSVATIALCFIFYSIYYTIILIYLYFSLSSHDVNLIIRKLTMNEFNFILKLYKIMIFCIILSIVYCQQFCNIISILL